MHYYKIFLFAFFSMILLSCKKDWIEEKPNKALDVPTTVKDFQALLDNTVIMNDNHPPLGEVSADNYYIASKTWDTWGTQNKNAHIWLEDIYANIITDNTNWNYQYRQVFYANIVLDGIEEVNAQDINTDEWNNVKGSAHYYRADAFFNVSQLYTRPYSLTFPEYPGIPLRLHADPNEKSVRSNLQQTYQQILNDLHGSVNYLPVIPQYKTRPSKPAAYALLSRVYLVMQDYSNALLYADSCLKLYDSLLDYNTLNANATYPVPGFNKEVIFQIGMADDLNTATFVDSNLYKSYDDNDLRKKLLFKLNASGQASFIGTYTGGLASRTNKTFGGIATDEVYLTRAECLARTGNAEAAMNDLNALLSKRWQTGTFVPFNATNASDALNLILQERRKETLFRGLRWLDLRRLNSEGANITLTRTINGQLYQLPPNDKRYTLPIPPDIIRITGMAQNER